MKTYDVKCPICGTVNKQLYLEETNGWLECEHCENVVGIMKCVKRKCVPRLISEPIIAARHISQ